MPVNLNVCGQVNKIFKETTARPYLFLFDLINFGKQNTTWYAQMYYRASKNKKLGPKYTKQILYRYTRLYREKGAKNFWGSGILRTIYYIEPKVCTHTIYFTTHTVGLKNEKNIAFKFNKSCVCNNEAKVNVLKKMKI